MTITTAHSGDRTIKLAPLFCPYCERGLHAHDIEIIGDDISIVCAGCHRDLLTVQRQ